MNLVNVSQTPHIRDNENTRSIMFEVILALLPTTIFGVYSFGLHSLIVIIVTIVACLISETIFNLIVHRKNTIGDLSAVVTGLILALNMPPEIPYYIPVIGAVFAIIVAKMLYGGLGQNFMNPALAGRCFLVISFASFMNDFSYKNGFNGIDIISEATPLVQIDEGNTVSLFNMFIGNIPGTIGEVSKICLLIGAIYLLVRKIISWRIPVFYLLSFVIFLYIFGSITNAPISDPNFILGQLFGGGLIFGAFFMATDYVTSPITKDGKIIYGLFLGFLTAIFRIFGKIPEGVSYTIIIANLIVPMIESLTIPKTFGKENDHEKK